MRSTGTTDIREARVIRDRIMYEFFTIRDQEMKEVALVGMYTGMQLKEGANKQVISSQADSLIKISRIWADFFPANTSNQPI